MKARKIDGKWWIVDTPEGVDEMGPYETRVEAEDDIRGVQRTLDDLDKKPGRWAKR
jgi:hypothetical protein